MKVSPLRHVVRSGTLGKLASRFIGPFPILGRIKTLAYRVELLRKMEVMHNILHVPPLHKCVHNSSSIFEPS